MAPPSSGPSGGDVAKAVREGGVGIGRRIIAFVADEDSANALRMGLIGVADDLDLRRGTIRHALRAFEREAGAQAAIIDVSGIADAHSELEALARVCPPDIKMLVIGDSDEIGFYRLLVGQLGVAEYMPKPLTRDTVQRVLLPHISERISEPAGGRGGRVVAVCGARGGVGTTTIAVSAALELARVAKGHVALLDLHLQGGAAALMLSARPGPGLRIALEDPERADALFLERTAITVQPRVRLIGAEEPFEITPAITEAGVTRVLDLLRQKFNYVVIDLPLPLAPTMRQVLAVARQVVVVLGPDVASVRDARAIRHMVTVLSGSDRVVTALNRADSRNGLTVGLIRKGLGAAPDITIPNLGARMMESFNLGIPAVQRVPALAAHLVPLLREIAGTQTAPARSWLRRMLRP